MLNLIDTQDKLKNFSEEQLIKEMQMPSGSAPQFLVLGEINRRQKMRQEAQRQQGMQQSTVAQDAVAAAGVPQGGLADMAGALAPKTDVSGNTGIAAAAEPQRMAEGGRVNKEYPSAAAMWELSNDPATIAMANRMGMSVTEYVRTLAPEAVSALAQRIQRGKDAAGRVYDDVFDPNRPVYDQTTPDQLGETFSQMRNNVRDQEVMGMGVNPSFAYDTAMREYGMGISDVPMTAPAMDSLPSITSGVDVRSPRAGGLGSLAEPVSERDRPAVSPSELPNAVDMRRGYALGLEGRTGLDTTPLEAFGGAGDSVDSTSNRTWGQRNIGDPLRALLQPVGDSAREIGQPIGDAAREIGQPIGAALSTAFDTGSLEYGPPRRRPASPELNAMEALYASGAMDDNLTQHPYITDGPSSRAGFRAGEQYTPEAPTYDPVQSRRVGRTERAPEDNMTEYSPLFKDIGGRRRRTQTLEDIMPPVVTAEEALAAEQRAAPETPAAAPTAAETAAPTGIAAATTGGTGGGSGGSGGGAGGGAGRMSSYEEELMNILKSREASRDQDKWLALAEAGLSMMASKDPNFGVAAGEAGLRAAQTYRQSRDQYDTDRLAIMKAIEDARLARATLAARAASGSTRGSYTDNQRYSVAENMLERAQTRLDTLQVAGITDHASAAAAGRSKEYQDAVDELEYASSILRGLESQVFSGAGGSSNVGGIQADISDSSAQ